MPLQNRVDPFGAIHAVAARGRFTGNRGVIHDPATRTLLGRRWTTRAWIICDLVHPLLVRRKPMGRNAPSGGAGWTELFFLDEVTALAAGHRPCFHCRRHAAEAFRAAFAAGQDRSSISAPEIDAILHGERPASGGKPIALDADSLDELPGGTMVETGGTAFARVGNGFRRWSFGGWGDVMPLAAVSSRPVVLVTPPSTVAALKNGFRPVWA